MTVIDAQHTAFALASTARMLEDGERKFRVRTGVWNFEEAVIDTSNESEAVARTITTAFRALAAGPSALGQHMDAALTPIERANVEKLFLDLAEAGVLVVAGERSSQDAVTAALLGRLTSPYPGATGTPEGDVLFITDNDASRQQAKGLAAGMRVNLRELDAATYERLDTSDLTTRMEGYDTERALEELRPQFAEAAVIVSCFQRPSLPFLRNLNRVVEGHDIPWISSFIDGPFVSIVGLKSPHTGCFECFEQRALARLEDHVAYHDFARSPIGQRSAQDTDAPMMSLVTVLAFTEGYLHAAVNASRMSGRVLGIHLPTMEIQTQDLLRMPNCPACGRVARQRLKEINFNSRAAVDRIVADVLR
ncbi:TOMM precursor leader peptide-binding protein [Stackebrandtia soli]|uniref:TOMM precursor leader peptide-binding protein n=1 Tax=Stackebrandtia soli TaxID=1892856 RepID=UPI0039E754AF